MNISFLIGNGFDLALGLKTSYDQFLNYYVHRLGEDAPNIKKIKDDIRQNMTNWSNAEKALGDYSSKFLVSESDAYCDCCENILLELSSYLDKEQSKLDIIHSKNIIAENFTKALSEFTQYILPESRRLIDSILVKHFYEERVFNFINFNYTKTLESCLSTVGEVINIRSKNNISFPDRIGKVIHVHGDTTDSMIMGVNDEYQLKNHEFRKSKRVRQSTIKPEINSRLHLDNIEVCSQIIKSSTIICIFGMSLGETDAIWWEKISAWISEDTSHHLVVFIYKEDYNPIFPRSFIEIEDRIRDMFFDYSSETSEKITSFQSRIHICINSRIFSDPTPLLLVE